MTGERRGPHRNRLLDTDQPHAGRGSWAYARLVVRFRWVIVGLWGVIVVLSVVVLPGLAQHQAGQLEGFIPVNSPPLRTEIRSFDTFGLPLFSRTVLVQHDPKGLSGWTQARTALLSAGLSQGEYSGVAPVLGGLPLSNSFPGTPAASARGTTILTYLFIPPRHSFSTQDVAAKRIGDRFLASPSDAYKGVTGTIPARAEQDRILQSHLKGFELATLVVVLAIIGINFRSIAAPVLTLVVNAVAFLVTTNASTLIGNIFGVAVPSELEPVLVALQIGVVTDYVIFFLSGLGRRVAKGEPRLVAARHATAEFGHLVLVAGITVAAGTGALLVARSSLFRAFGPGMIMAILIGLTVAITLVPALMAIFGGWIFWPRPTKPPSDHDLRGRDIPGPGPARLLARAFNGEAVRWMTERRNAKLVVAGSVAGLAILAIPVTGMTLGLSFIPALPADNPVRVAAVAAQDGFAAGVTSPTELLIEGKDVTRERDELDSLQTAIGNYPGIAGVLGPSHDVLPTELGIFLARNQQAARILLIFNHEPLGGNSVHTVTQLRKDLPRMAREAGLGPVKLNLAGDSAIAETIVTTTQSDILRIALAAVAVNLLLLIAFLRSLVAPIYLLASSILALLATLGLTTFVFQNMLGHDGLTFYVPFAAAVLLLSLGSDYNIFGVGHVWSQARHEPLRAAVITALPQTTRAITAAGITLAISFGLLAIVPLAPFRELAFAMAVGILLDAVVVRSFLVPCLLILVGPRSAWPGPPLLPDPVAPHPDTLAPGKPHEAPAGAV